MSPTGFRYSSPRTDDPVERVLHDPGQGTCVLRRRDDHGVCRFDARPPIADCFTGIAEVRIERWHAIKLAITIDDGTRVDHRGAGNVQHGPIRRPCLQAPAHARESGLRLQRSHVEAIGMRNFSSRRRNIAAASSVGDIEMTSDFVTPDRPSDGDHASDVERIFRVSARLKTAPWVSRTGRGHLLISPQEVRFEPGRFMRLAIHASASAPVSHLEPKIVYVPQALPGGGFDLMLRPADRSTFAIVNVAPWRARAVRTALESAHFELVRRRPWTYFGFRPAN